MSLLAFIIATPLIAAVAILLLPSSYSHLSKIIAQGAAGMTFLLSLGMFLLYPEMAAGPGGFKFYQKTTWVESIGINFQVGADGINVGLILMGAAVALAASFACWGINRRKREFYFLFLMMVGGILGAFASLDVFFFYFFHELALVPTFIMIGVWGRGENRNYATFKITIYLTIGAMLALVGLVALYIQSGANTFDLVEMTNHVKEQPIPTGQQNIIFPLLLFGFGILVSLWPFHTWAPIGYNAAPTAAAMLHAGVLKKFGLYGLIRLAIPMVPEGIRTWLEVLCVLALGNILYCGWVAMRQRNLNFLIGNSSVAHMGMAFLGIASLSLIGVTGAVAVMVAHGLLAALSFGLSGYLHHQKDTVEISKLGGLLQQLPFIGVCLIIAMLAGCGVPGFANFAGEILVLFGAWESLPWFVIAGAWGALIIGAIYCLRAIRNILHGAIAEENLTLTDANNGLLKLPFVLLIVLLVVFGIYPRLLTNKISQSAEPLIEQANSGSVRLADQPNTTISGTAALDAANLNF
ncbi:MAG: NAD(P)H-quinone oxidoreductase chain 4 1 [Verrucomicrobia subdivision 3 bacterium]|nr:NAD(P)H-quinone oxidoreductase chain 4 1 [Limisphaerales bacterium]MCS1415064.1 NAD(P)H-quinone oxidoreductase chain 4 1 [Limisphaerales bacterium]